MHVYKKAVDTANVLFCISEINRFNVPYSSDKSSAFDYSVS